MSEITSGFGLAAAKESAKIGLILKQKWTVK
jgi:hypothetical protein